MRRRSKPRSLPVAGEVPPVERYPWDLPAHPGTGSDDQPIGPHDHTNSAPPRRRKYRTRNQYNYGRTIEWAIRNELRNRGYHVIRSAGSKGRYDLLAGKMNETWLIQAKGQRPTPAEFQAMVDASHDWWHPHVIIWRNRDEDITPKNYGPKRSRWESRIYLRGEQYTKQRFPGTSDEIESQFQMGTQDDE